VARLVNSPPVRFRLYVFAAVLHAVLGVLPARSWAQTQAPASPTSQHKDLTTLNIEDLMQMEVTSVSKKEQKLSQTAAAVFVMTQDDIARSGATNIPDLLRRAPGVNVARINANTWAISVRGLNDLFSNELLVLLDGRTVYVPSSGGVFWDTLDLPLEDIARIEVIRGPGGSVWGANAVNGVINIVTKSASQSKGALVVAGGGGVHREFATLQYGGQLGKSFDYRVYSKYFNEESLPAPAGGSLGDGWHSLRGGFRADATLSRKDTLTVQGDLYANREGSPTSALPSITSPAPLPVQDQQIVGGGFVQTSWNHTLSNHSATQLMLTFERYARGGMLGETRNLLDLDFQQNFGLGNRHSFVWGLDFRYTSFDTKGSLLGSLNPASAAKNLYSGFIQDEIAVVPGRFLLTLGTKLEYHYYSGLTTMPSARLAWTPNLANTLWAAVSLAERTPGELDTTFRANIGSIPASNGSYLLLSSFGNPHLKNEGMLAYEAGYRAAPAKSLSLDFAAYYNRYDHQETLEPSALFSEDTPAPPHMVLPLVYQNLMHGGSHGFEIFSDWRVSRNWILSPVYAFEQIHMHLEPLSVDFDEPLSAEGSSPVHSAQLRSHYVLPRGFSWDVSAFYVGRLRDPELPSYTRLDTQLAWQWKEDVILSFVGQNLLMNAQPQFVDDHGVARSSLDQRSAYAKFTWRF
jgi:iron complex outermembrane recepter protein